MSTLTSLHGEVHLAGLAIPNPEDFVLFDEAYRRYQCLVGVLGQDEFGAAVLDSDRRLFPHLVKPAAHGVSRFVDDDCVFMMAKLTGKTLGACATFVHTEFVDVASHSFAAEALIGDSYRWAERIHREGLPGLCGECGRDLGDDAGPLCLSCMDPQGAVRNPKAIRRAIQGWRRIKEAV